MNRNEDINNQDIQKDGKEKKTSLRSEIISWIQIIVAALVIAFFLNNFIIAPYRKVIEEARKGNTDF